MPASHRGCSALHLRLDVDGAAIAAVEAAAAALAAGGIPETAFGFDEEIVGPFGAGFAWRGAAAEQSVLVGDADSDVGDFVQVRSVSMPTHIF